MDDLTTTSNATNQDAPAAEGKKRIKPGDALAEWLQDLRRQARTLDPFDADARERWFAGCADVLAAVPERDQRMSWAYLLTMDLRSLVGTPVPLVMGELMRRAMEIRRCAV